MFHRFRDARRTEMAKTTTAILLTTFIAVTAIHADDKKKVTVTIDNQTNADVNVNAGTLKDYPVHAGHKPSPTTEIDSKATSISWEAFTINPKTKCDGDTAKLTIKDWKPVATITVKSSKCEAKPPPPQAKKDEPKKDEPKKTVEPKKDEPKKTTDNKPEMTEFKLPLHNKGGVPTYVVVTWRLYSRLLSEFTEMDTHSSLIPSKGNGDATLKVPSDLEHPGPRVVKWQAFRDASKTSLCDSGTTFPSDIDCN